MDHKKLQSVMDATLLAAFNTASLAAGEPMQVILTLRAPNGDTLTAGNMEPAEIVSVLHQVVDQVRRNQDEANEARSAGRLQ